jgi:hypothetical protein
LGVVALSGLVRQPAARLKVKILQIVARPRAARIFIENLAMSLHFATSMDLREVLEKQSRATNQREQRTVMIGGNWINARFDIGEVLQELASPYRHRGGRGLGQVHWYGGGAALSAHYFAMRPRPAGAAPSHDQDTKPRVATD